MNISNYKTLIVFALCVCLAPAEYAESETLDMNIKGSITATGSCTFSNEGETLAVDFGGIDFDVDPSGGKKLKTNPVKELNSTMTCTGDTYGARMTLNTPLVATDESGTEVIGVLLSGESTPSLGLRLMVDDIVKPVAKAFNIDAAAPPKLSVELIQLNDGSSFTSGVAFSASASLVLDFP